MKIAVEENIPPRIGAQFFANPDDTSEDTQKHFKLMSQYGIRMVRLFLLWEHVEPSPGQWDFRRYDYIYDLAKKHGIQIVSTLTAEDPPHWFVDKPFYHHYANLNDPDLKDAASRYIEAVVTRYHKHPAHYAWILMNEPEVLVNQEPCTLQEFHKWLESQYSSVEALNAKWFRQYNQFSDIVIHSEEAREYWQCFPSFIDWNRFLKANLIQQLNWIKSQVRIIDSSSPLHLNPKGFFGNLAPVGQDYWKENTVSDILGASIHPAWKFGWFEREDYGLAFAFCVDIIRSAGNGKSFWVTELQSGATLMTGTQPFTPTPQELTAWLWDAFGAGAKAVIYWMWHPRTYGQEAGEWGIVTANHRVSKRLSASSEVSRVIKENSVLFASARPELSRTAILYNHATELLSLIEGSELYRAPEAPVQALVGVYSALMRNQIPVDFISEEQILSGGLSKYDTLYLPYSYAMDTSLQRAVASYVKQGGNLWAEAPCAWKNGYGEILREPPLSDVFGFRVNEFCGYGGTGGEDSPCLCWADLELTGADVLSRFEDHSPAVLSHRYGQGKAVFVNSTPSLGYFRTKKTVFEQQIAFLAVEQTKSVFTVRAKGGNLIHRVLQTDNQYIVILENWGPPSPCTICSAFQVQVSDFLTGEVLCSQTDTVCIDLGANETRLLLFK